MTNFEKFKSMSIDELVGILEDKYHRCDYCVFCVNYSCERDCRESFL